MSSKQEEADNNLLLTPSRNLFNYPAVYCSASANSHGNIFIAFHKSLATDAVGYAVGTFTTGFRLVMEQHENLDHCDGVYPKTTINDERTVLVVFTRKYLNPLSFAKVKYTIGAIEEEGKPVVWNTPEEICKGEDPDIDIKGNKVLLVFCKCKDLFYMTGLLNESSRQITWGPETKIDDNGCYPSVAMTGDAFIVLYQDRSTSRLKTMCGKIQQKDHKDPCKLICGIAQEHKQDGDYYTGEYPSVAIFDDYTFVVTHQTGLGAARKIHGRSGKVNLNDMVTEWHQKKADYLLRGTLTSLAAVNGHEKTFIEVHSTPALGGTTSFYEGGCTKNI